MPVVADDFGRMTVEPHPATTGPAGRYCQRIEPQGTDADLVRVVGVVPIGNLDAGYAAELVVSSASYGAAPDEWEGQTTITYDPNLFLEHYTDVTPDELARFVANEAKASAAATKAAAKRDSPWSRS